MLKSLSLENGRPNLKSVSALRSREVEEDFKPNYVCLAVCLVVKTIVVWKVMNCLAADMIYRHLKERQWVTKTAIVTDW